MVKIGGRYLGGGGVIDSGTEYGVSKERGGGYEKYIGSLALIKEARREPYIFWTPNRIIMKYVVGGGGISHFSYQKGGLLSLLVSRDWKVFKNVKVKVLLILV
jgi:hypothetical protein